MDKISKRWSRAHLKQLKKRCRHYVGIWTADKLEETPRREYQRRDVVVFNPPPRFNDVVGWRLSVFGSNKNIATRNSVTRSHGLGLHVTLVGQCAWRFGVPWGGDRSGDALIKRIVNSLANPRPECWLRIVVIKRKERRTYVQIKNKERMAALQHSMPCLSAQIIFSRPPGRGIDPMPNLPKSLMMRTLLFPNCAWAPTSIYQHRPGSCASIVSSWLVSSYIDFLDWALSCPLYMTLC